MDLQTLVDLSLFFVAYYLVELLIRLVLRAWHPKFFDHLLAVGKLRALTAFCLGVLITLFSAPVCASACMSRLAEPGWDAKMCLTSRVILLVAELNRLDHDHLIVTHHVAVLFVGWATISLKMPIYALLVCFASLIAEIIGDVIWILSAYAASLESQPPELIRLKAVLSRLNVVQYAILRIVGVGLSMWLFGTDADFQHQAAWIHWLGWFIELTHAAYCLWYINLHFRKAWAPKSLNRPFITIHMFHKPPNIRMHTSNFHLGADIIFTLYGVFMGLGFSLLFVVVLILVPSHGTLSALPIIQLSAILGARVASLVFEDGISAFLHSPVTTLLRPGFWLHGGIVGAVIGICYCHIQGMIDDLWLFFGAMGVALPIYETASRIGCHFYGCCFGRPLSSLEIEQSRISWHFRPITYVAYSRMPPSLAGKALFPIQLYSAFLFLLLFLGTVPLTWYTSTSFAGFLALAVHAVIRIYTERHRADYRGAVSWSLSATGKFAVGQMVVGLVGAGVFSGMISETYVRSQISTPFSVRHVMVADTLRTIIVSFAVGFAFYGVHRGEISTKFATSNSKETSS